jgi:membrane fusion protein, multidrug efflux system
MKRILIFTIIIIFLVGACTLTLWMNKAKIDAKAKVDGNLKSIPVFVTEIRKQKITDDFTTNGTFSAIHELTLLSEGQGKVVSLLFNTGDVVKEGQVLAGLDDDLVRSQLLLAQANLEKAKTDLQKYEGLLKADAVSNQQVEDARLFLKKTETDVTTLKKQLDYMSIKAPIQGTIVKRYIETGSFLMPGAMVADIVDISRLKFIANVAETEAIRIDRRMKVDIVSSMFPGVHYQGTVASIGVRADEAKRFPVEIEIPNDPVHQLKAGMFGTASFTFGDEKEVLIIPRHSIIGSIKVPKVYVVEGDKAVLHDIRIGKATDLDVEVLEGLKPGDKVVTSGQINLDNNSLITIVNNK